MSNTRINHTKEKRDREKKRGMERTMRFVINLIALAVLFNIVAFTRVGVKAQLDEGSKVVHTLEYDVGRPSGVVWVVQLSDLHISLFHTERARALQKLMGTIIRTIQPSLVLITGDLTDAKSKGGTSTQQYKEEWITYQETVDLISNESGIPLNLFYDIRGNHDKYGVPYANSSLDYYSQYSCNARQKRTSLVQSITLLDNSGGKNLFVGVDDSMSVGLRGPSNLFGHPSDSVIAKLDTELSHWDNYSSGPITKIVFGHFPMSFTASSETGHHSEEIMAKHNISAYLCGHLHCKFGRQLYKHHVTTLGEFWEWEMGDWRVNRMMRVLAIDHGHVSFVDVDLSQISKDVLNGEMFVMPTIILPTSPLDSRVMLRSTNVVDQAAAGTIRALVFSNSSPTSVTATVFDSVTNSFVDYVMVETLKMDRVSGPLTNEQGGSFFYEAVWDNQNYTDTSATRYWLQIEVTHNGVSTKSRMWPFSVEGKKSPFTLTFLGYIAIGVKWETYYPVILWTIICVIFGGLLILPKLVFLYLEKKGVYDSWTSSIFYSDSTYPYFKLLFWALLEGARNRFLWWGQVIYIAFLLIFPWFWGRVLADDYPVGYMTLWGWTVWPSKGTVAHQSGLGWPDIMGIVLPYMCAVVLPLVLLVSALCAEQGACEIVKAPAGGPVRKQDSKKTNGGFRRHLHGDIGNQDGQPLLEKHEDSSQSAEEGLETASEDEEEEEERAEQDERATWRFLDRKIRIVYLVCCFAIAFLHLRLCLFLALAYGARAVFLSPIYVWAVPSLIVASIFMTSPVEPRNLPVN